MSDESGWYVPAVYRSSRGIDLEAVFFETFLVGLSLSAALQMLFPVVAQ